MTLFKLSQLMFQRSRRGYQHEGRGHFTFGSISVGTFCFWVLGVWGCGDKSVSYLLCGHCREGRLWVFVLWCLGKSVVCPSVPQLCSYWGIKVWRQP